MQLDDRLKHPAVLVALGAFVVIFIAVFVIPWLTPGSSYVPSASQQTALSNSPDADAQFMSDLVQRAGRGPVTEVPTDEALLTDPEPVLYALRRQGFYYSLKEQDDIAIADAGGLHTREAMQMILNPVRPAAARVTQLGPSVVSRVDSRVRADRMPDAWNFVALILVQAMGYSSDCKVVTSVWRRTYVDGDIALVVFCDGLAGSVYHTIAKGH